MAFSRTDQSSRSPDELRAAAKDRGRQLIRRRRGVKRAAVAIVAAAAVGTLIVVVAFGPRSSVPSTTPTSRPPSGSTLARRPVVNAAAFAGYGRLAFVSGGELYVLDGTTKALHQVTEGSPPPSSPAFSHDGEWLAFLRVSIKSNGEGEALWIARGDGTDAHRVAQVPPAYPAPNSGAPVFSWSPTSDELLVTTGPVAGAPLVPREIWIVSAPGTAHRLLGPGYTSGAIWSPDGAEVAVLWNSHGVSNEVLETVSPSGGSGTIWHPADGSTYYLAGWSRRFGILVWYDQGNGGPSVENYGLTLGAFSEPGGTLTLFATAPLFEPPALAVGPQGELVLVANGNESNGGGEGEKFVWFGKTVETCSPTSDTCSAVVDQTSAVTLDPAISPVDGSLAFVEAPQSTQGLPPDYSPVQTWSQISGWYAAHTLWVVPGGTGTPRQVPGTTGASDPVWSSRGTGLVYVDNGELWLLRNPNARPVEVASPLVSATRSLSGTYLFGYADWSSEFAWTGLGGNEGPPS